MDAEAHTYKCATQDDCTARLVPSVIPTHVDGEVNAAELAAATTRAKVGC
jgi:hypothetical protein